MIDGIAPANTFVQVQSNILGGSYNLDTSVPVEGPSALNISDGSLIIEDNIEENMLINLSGIEIGENSESSLIGELLQSVTEIDSDYKNVLGRMVEWPDFNNYLESKGETLHGMLDDTNIGITHISNIEEQMPESKEDFTMKQIIEESREKFHASQEKQMAFNSAAIEYNQDSTRWGISTQLWSSKVKLLTAAVSQINTGLKTLFTSQ